MNVFIAPSARGDVQVVLDHRRKLARIYALAMSDTTTVSTPLGDVSGGADVRTFCRICEPSCGLIAQVEDGVLVKLSPDRDHPVTKGFACHKGLAAVDVHHDPDRLDSPMLRRAGRHVVRRRLGRGDGDHRRTPAGDHRRARRRRGRGLRRQPDGVQRARLAARRRAAARARRAPHLLVRHAGLRQQVRRQRGGVRLVDRAPDPRPRPHRPVPHHRREPAGVAGQLLLDPQRARRAAPGHGPRRSHRVRQPAAHRDARARRRRHGARSGPTPTCGSSPRCCTRSTRSAGSTREVIARHGRNVDGLRAFIAAYPPDRVADVTGIAADAIRELAAAWVATPRASVHASTGINMGRQGTLAYWLVHMLSFVTGRLDVEGGNLKSDGFYPNARSGAGVPEQGYVDTEFGRLRRGALPGTLMSHAILDSDEPVRALIVVAGNPLLSIAGQERLRKAFEQLELLVVIDIYPSATAELAHVVLPATDMYERDDLNIVNIGTSAQPFAQYTPAVVAPAGRAPAGVVDRPSPAAGARPRRRSSTTTSPIRGPSGGTCSHAGSGHRPRRPAGHRRGRACCPRPTPGEFFDAQVLHRRRARRLLPGRVRRGDRALPRPVRRGRGATTAAAGCASSTGRDAWMHNSWFANVARMKRGGRTANPLCMHPDDAAALGLADGDAVRVTSDHGAIDCRRRARRRSDARRGVDGARLGPRGQPAAARRRRAPGRQPERAAADRAGQLRAAVQPGAHDRHPGHRHVARTTSDDPGCPCPRARAGRRR